MVAGGMVGLIALLALVVDGGMFMHERQSVQNAVDSAALAGAQELPDDTAGASASALAYAASNDSDLVGAQAQVTFRCVVGDRNGNGAPDPEDIPAACDPGGGAAWVCSNGICSAVCVPAQGDSCNTIVVEGNKDVVFSFSPVLEVIDAETCFTSQCNTGQLRAAACRGSCGSEPSVPVDVIIVIDRSGSMSTADLNNAKNAARSVMELYNPELQHIGLAVLGPSRLTNLCQSPSSGGTWLPVQLSSNYKNADGTLNASSSLVSVTNCLTTSSVGTNLTNPTQAAVAELTGPRARPGVAKGIIFMTDGEANVPGSNPCLSAANAATAAKAAGIEIFTVGFGIAGARCSSDSTSSPWRNDPATQLLAAMATSSVDESGCTSAANTAVENADGDHFLCEARTGDLEPIFRQAAEALAGGARLIQLPEWG